MHLVFEWDETKDNLNQAKHQIAFEEAKTVFNDPFSLTIPDPDHSQEEERWLDIGFSHRGHLLVVWYTENGDRIRIIGSRYATKTEVNAYHHERTRRH